MRKYLLLLLLSFTAFASDNIIVPPGSGTAYFEDNTGHVMPLAIAYTTDGAGNLHLVNSSDPVDDTLVIPPGSGKMYLQGADDLLYPAEVLYTTDGNGNVIPIPAGGGGGSYTATPPLVLTGSAFSIPKATSVVDGYLAALDKAAYDAYATTKEPTITASTSSKYWRGDKTFQTLDTSVVPENGPLYFTNARAQGAVSANSPLVDTAGVFSIPLADNATDGYLSAADHIVFATVTSKEPAISSGTSAQYWRGDKTFQTLNTTAVPEGANLYFTNARAQGAVSASAPLVDTAGVFSIPLSNNSTDGYLSGTDHTIFANKEPAITSGTTLQYWRGDKSFQTLDTSVVPENGNLYFTNARAQGAVSATAPLVDTTGVFSIPLATNSVDGYLSATDRTAFNAIASNGITALTSDVTATGPGSVAATVASVGGSTAALVHAGELLANASTSANTVSTIIRRDSSGNFIAGTMTGNIVGAASGGALTATGGPAPSNGNGGQVTVAGASGSNVGSGGAGGNLNLNGGIANGDNTVNQSGGAVAINGGQSKGGATGGTVTISSGTGGVGTGTAGATGGTTNINGGTGGAGSATSGNGGGATLKAGSGGGGVVGGVGGTAQCVGGTGGTGSTSGGNGGPANLTGGSPGGNANAQGGAVVIAGAGGSATGAGGAGGAVTITSGSAGGDNTQNNTAGSITITAGTSKGSSSGPNVTITGGTGGPGTATTGATGGVLDLKAGIGGLGSSTGGTGGDLKLTAGAGGNSTTPGAGGNIMFFTGPNQTVAEHFRISSAGNAFVSNGNIQAATVGFGLGIKNGANGRIGTATLTNSSVTVSNTSVTANTLIFVTTQVTSGGQGALSVSKNVGVGFTITSQGLLDNSTVGWFMVEQI